MFTPIAFGLFGLIAGSFLNVLIMRWGTRVLTGRSACVTCDATICWYDLIPVLSWMVLRGRCRSCGAHISRQYIFVEAGTGLLFFFIGFAPLPLYVRLIALPIGALLLAIAVYDLRTKLIPDAWVYAFASLALVSLFVFPSYSIPPVPYSLFAGPLVALPLFALWFFSRGSWMGLGDVKLALGMGWLLGASGGYISLLLAFLLGALVSTPLLLFSSPAWKYINAHITPRYLSQKFALTYTMKSEVPFGPFLVFATLVVWLSSMYGFDLIVWSMTYDV